MVYSEKKYAITWLKVFKLLLYFRYFKSVAMKLDFCSKKWKLLLLFLANIYGQLTIPFEPNNNCRFLLYLISEIISNSSDYVKVIWEIQFDRHF